MNSYQAIGYVGSDPRLTPTENTLVATFSIAVAEFYRQNDELQKKTHWIPCVAFGRLAELSGEFLRKGSQVGIRGTLNQRQWVTEQGEKINRLQVLVKELEFLSPRASDAKESTSHYKGKEKAAVR